MKFGDLAKYLEKLEKTSSRIEITKILSDLFKKTGSKEIDKVIYLLSGSLAPSYKGIVFNLAEKMMIRVIARAYRGDLEKVKSEYKKLGDLGTVAGALAKNNEKKLKEELSILEVYESLLEIAKDSGEESQERKIEKTANLLKGLDPLSSKFVARIPTGKLRLGFSDKTVLDGLSWMVAGDKRYKKQLESAYNVLPDTGLLAKGVKEKGMEKATKDVKPIVGVPVSPMLAQRLKSPIEMIDKMGEVAVEPKLDGLRISIHYRRKDNFVKAFTRNMNEVSWMFPELSQIGKYVKANELILDSEAMGLDEKSLVLANFQTTMTRRRKHEIEETSKKIPIKFYVFDVLFKDGDLVMNKNYPERRKELENTILSDGIFKLVDYRFTKDPKVITNENLKRKKEGFEGIMVKKVDSEYIPGRTGWRWVKMKEAEDSAAKLSDTVDSVVMGFSAGRGKRASFGLGQFLVGVKDKGEFKTITKVGTGLTDVQFRELNKRLKNLKTSERPKEYEVHKDLYPDTWVNPSLVVEIAADEITKSPKHTAGLALRFPRLVRFRDDKSPNQATTIKELRNLFDIQKKP